MRFTDLIALLPVVVAGCVSATASVPDVTMAPQTTTLTPHGGSISAGGTADVVPISASLSAGPDSAYHLLKVAYVALEIPVTEEDPSKRLIGNVVLKARRHLAGLPMQAVVFCGERMGVPNAETWEIQLDIRSYIVPDGKGGSQLWTKLQALGHDPTTSNRDMMTCTTQGNLEAKLGNFMKLALLKKR
jgi:hypothetical protein